MLDGESQIVCTSIKIPPSCPLHSLLLLQQSILPTYLSLHTFLFPIYIFLQSGSQKMQLRVNTKNPSTPSDHIVNLPQQPLPSLETKSKGPQKETPTHS